MNYKEPLIDQLFKKYRQAKVEDFVALCILHGINKNEVIEFFSKDSELDIENLYKKGEDATLGWYN